VENVSMFVRGVRSDPQEAFSFSLWLCIAVSRDCL
jgi:hypothetical protein